VKKLSFPLAFSVFLLLIFIFMIYQALEFQILARYFPLTIASLGAVLLVVEIIFQLKNKETTKKNEEINSNTLKYLAWIVGYMILIFIIGFILATIVFLFAFFKTESGYSLIKNIITTAVVIGVIFILEYFLNLNWPTGLFL
jgi:TRAP-type C4-dicarboxylate transport system permease small subunit